MAKILVAEDNDALRRLIILTLEDVGQVDVVEARHGQEAIDLALRERPAALFLDLRMPRRDGIQVCRLLRARPETADAKIVIVTGSTDDEERQRALDAGADLLLTKPFSPLELLEIVDALPIS